MALDPDLVPTISDRIVYAGDTATFYDTLPLDITGMTTSWQVAKRPLGVSILTKTPVVIDAAAGEISVTPTHEDTSILYGPYYWRATVTEGAVTVIAGNGKFLVRPRSIGN